jgi:asparagine synthase (glutamine-hydrolysing)
MVEPYGGGLPSWSVFKHMDGDVKVALTGTGGDELFGNYFKFRPLESGIWPAWLRNRRPVGQDRFRRQFHDAHYYCLDAEKRTHMFAAGFDAPADTGDLLFAHFSAVSDPTVRDRSTRTDFETQLPEEFLAMTDRFSMAHSIEARTPFLDHELIETVMRIPAAQRLHGRRYKQLLRRAIADLLPDELLDAPKKGFVMPLRLWLRGRLRPLAERLLAPERLWAQGIFQPSFFDWAVRPHLEGQADNTTLVWGALMFQIWHAVFIESTAGERPGWDVKALSS